MTTATAPRTTTAARLVEGVVFLAPGAVSIEVRVTSVRRDQLGRVHVQGTEVIGWPHRAVGTYDVYLPRQRLQVAA